jgi:Methylamine utilisation protein MauE
MTVVATLLCVYLILTLGAAALAKKPSHVRLSLVRQGLVGRRTATILSGAIQPVELGVAVGLVVGAAFAAWGALALLVVFMGYRVLVRLRGSVYPCACIGQGRAAIDGADIAASALMVTAAVAYSTMVSSGHPASRVAVVAVLASVGLGVVSSKIYRTRAGAAVGREEPG